jgi:hypothetical protein
MNHKVLEFGVTHPTIHVDYYQWLNDMTPFEREFVKKQCEEKNAHGLLMFAWSRSRETLKEKAKQ